MIKIHGRASRQLAGRQGDLCHSLCRYDNRCDSFVLFVNFFLEFGRKGERSLQNRKRWIAG